MLQIFKDLLGVSPFLSRSKKRDKNGVMLFATIFF